MNLHLKSLIEHIHRLTLQVNRGGPNSWQALQDINELTGPNGSIMEQIGVDHEGEVANVATIKVLRADLDKHGQAWALLEKYMVIEDCSCPAGCPLSECCQHCLLEQVERGAL